MKIIAQVSSSINEKCACEKAQYTRQTSGNR